MLMQPDDLIQAAKQARINKKTEAEKQKAQTDTQEQKSLLESNREAMLRGFTLLIEYMEGKTTKTEVVNQLESISTPDIEKVVEAVNSLEKVVSDKDVDLSPLAKSMEGLGAKLDQLPKSFPDIPEAKDEIAITNLDVLSKKIDQAIKAIKAIEVSPEFSPEIKVAPSKVDVKAPDVNVNLDELVAVMQGVSARLDVMIESTPQFPWEQLEVWLKKIDQRLEWIGTRPIPMGGASTTTTTTPTESVYDTAVYDTGTYS